MSPVPDLYETTSLLPYLNGDACVRLCLTDPAASGDGGRFPFFILDDSDPVTRLLAGRFVTGGGGVLKRVFLLMGRDRYLLPASSPWPVSNPDMDAAWSKALPCRESGRDDTAPLSLAGRAGPDGFLPFSPLFYCTKRDLFFHPPCPLCGSPLRLCVDDHLLAGRFLQPYSSTTYRYLYCGQCADREDAAFYIYERDHSSPPALRDCRDLVRSFSSPGATVSRETMFPCGECPERRVCFGAEFAADGRIVPFSFYPFHLLVFDAFTLHSREFLSLISGASFDETGGRLHPLRDRARLDCLKVFRGDTPSAALLFPFTDSRCWLEILYLKLSFLEDLLLRAARVPSDMSLSLDAVWVKIPERSDRLPCWWNFSIGVVDIIRPRPAFSSFAVQTSAAPLLHAGLIFFSVLLANGRQDAAEVFRALEGGMGGEGESAGRSWELPDGDSVFAPENIFRDPGSFRIPASWHSLWRRALLIGFQLLRSSRDGDCGRGWEAFREDMPALRSDVRRALFAQVPEAPEEAAGKASPPDGQWVHDLLMRIAGRWRDEQNAAPPPPPPESGAPDGIMETVILSGSREDGDFSGFMDTDEFMETIILSPRDRAGNTAPPLPGECDEAVPETLIIQTDRPEPANNGREVAGPPTEPPGQAEPPEPLDTHSGEEDDLAETVILAPRGSDPRMKGRRGKNGA